jgi:hypothetical protein
LNWLAEIWKILILNTELGPVGDSDLRLTGDLEEQRGANGTRKPRGPNQLVAEEELSMEETGAELERESQRKRRGQKPDGSRRRVEK